MRGSAALLMGLATSLLVVGCGSDGTGQLRTSFDSSNSDMTVAEAAQMREMPLFWLGREFEGLPLISISGDGRFEATFIYGDCRARSDEGCSPPVQIQTVKMCRPRISSSAMARLRTLRGVRAGEQGGGLALLSRAVEIRIFGDGGGRGTRAAQAMRAVNPDAPGAVGSAEPLPPPPRGAERRTPCSVTGR